MIGSIGVVPNIPDHARKFYSADNIRNLENYVQRLILQGMPMWMVEEERVNFRTASDTGANEGYLRCWNAVRRAHGFPKLTKDELWQRHADSNNWTDEYRDFQKHWSPLWYKSYSAYRDAYPKPAGGMEGNVITIPEFTGKKFRDG